MGKILNIKNKLSKVREFFLNFPHFRDFYLVKTTRFEDFSFRPLTRLSETYSEKRLVFPDNVSIGSKLRGENI